MTLPTVTFSGLASPFDAGALIDGLMEAERIPLLNMQSRRAGFQQKDEAWQSVNVRLSALRSAYHALDLTGFALASSSNEAAAGATVTGTPGPGSVAFTIDRLAASHQMVSGVFADPDSAAGAGDLTITVDGVDHIVTADAATTFTELAASVNALDAGVTATVLEVDAGSYRLLLTADTSGDASVFTATSGIAGLGSISVIQAGVDAQISIGSLTIERAENTITDLLPGVTIDLKAVSATPVVITAQRDLESAADAMAALVDELNQTLTTLGDLTRYNSVTETAAILMGDSTARGLIASLRNAVSGSVGGPSGTLIPAAVGISITRSGTFEFDRSAFEAALSSDFEGTAALFDDTVLPALDAVLDGAEGAAGSIARARDRWQAQIELMDDRIEQFEDRLDRREAALIRQFAAVDQALGMLSTQSSWLTQQIEALGGNG